MNQTCDMVILGVNVHVSLIVRQSSWTRRRFLGPFLRHVATNFIQEGECQVMNEVCLHYY